MTTQITRATMRIGILLAALLPVACLSAYATDQPTAGAPTAISPWTSSPWTLPVTGGSALSIPLAIAVWMYGSGRWRPHHPPTVAQRQSDQVAIGRLNDQIDQIGQANVRTGADISRIIERQDRLDALLTELRVSVAAAAGIQ